MPRLLVLCDSRKRVSPLLASLAYSDSESQTTGPLSTHSLTGKELLELYDSTERLSLDSIGAHQKFQARAIKLVTPDAVMKMGEEVEVISTQYVRTSTVIPVPDAIVLSLTNSARNISSQNTSRDEPYSHAGILSGGGHVSAF